MKSPVEQMRLGWVRFARRSRRLRWVRFARLLPEMITIQTTQTQSKPTEGLIWARLIQPKNGDLAEDAARDILSLNFSATDKDRMRDLAQRNNE